MAAPNILQGSLNRLITSVVFPSFPGLNITPPFTGAENMELTIEGNLTTNLPTMTGHVTSPEPYAMATITGHLIRAQSFAQLWKAQIEQNTLLGSATVRTDSAQLTPYYINNVTIIRHERLGMSGRDASFVLALQGNWQINAALWPS